MEELDLKAKFVQTLLDYDYLKELEFVPVPHQDYRLINELKLTASRIFGYDETNEAWLALRLDTDGYLKIVMQSGSTISVSNFPTDYPDANTLTELQAKLDEAVFTARFGEVQASPTTNTLLGRVKSVEDKLDTINTTNSGLLTESDFDTRTGEVQASPTAYTLLGRIKSVEDKLDTLETTCNAIETAIEIIDNMISGSEAQVDIVASIPAGTNNIGKIVPTDGTDDLAINSDGSINSIAGSEFSSVTTLVNNVTYDDDPTSSTSSSVDCDGYRHFCFFYDLGYTASPTAITMQIQFSPDDTNWFDYSNNFWGYLKESKVSITVSGIDRALHAKLAGRYIRLVVTATGTTAANKITLTAKVMLYK